MLALNCILIVTNTGTTGADTTVVFVAAVHLLALLCSYLEGVQTSHCFGTAALRSSVRVNIHLQRPLVPLPLLITSKTYLHEHSADLPATLLY